MTNVFNPLANLNSLVEAAVATQDVDMTETGTGGGAYEDVLLPKGDYYGHFVEYVEYGKRIPTNNGKPTGKPAVLNARVCFIVYGPNGEKKRIRSWYLPVFNSERANFKKLFDRLNYDGNTKHAAQKLGTAWVIPVEQHTSKAGKTSNVIDYSLLRPLPKFDPNTGEPIVIPALNPEDVKVFLWNNPTKETWDSLYIDGVKDDGTSKNFIQEDIMKAVDFEGSPLQQMLTGGIPAPESLAPAPATAPAAPTAPAQPAPVAPAAPAAPVAPAAPMAPPSA